MSEEIRKPRSVRVMCDLPDPAYEGKWVERKVRITISDFEAIARLTTRLAGLRQQAVEAETGEAEELRKQIAETELKLHGVYASIITDWNLEDDYGDPLPQPFGNAEVFGSAVLSMDEYSWITNLIQDSLQEIRARAAKTVEGKNSPGS